jgi:hypothetical protein
MKRLLISTLIVPVTLLGAARPARAGNAVAAVLAGVLVGLGAALVLEVLAPPPVVAAPVVVRSPVAVGVPAPPPVAYRPAPVIVHTPPPVFVPVAPGIHHPPAPGVYRPLPIGRAPRHGGHPPHRRHVRCDHGPWHWHETPRNDH